MATICAIFEIEKKNLKNELINQILLGFPVMLITRGSKEVFVNLKEPVLDRNAFLDLLFLTSENENSSNEAVKRNKQTATNCEEKEMVEEVGAENDTDVQIP